MSDTKEHGMMKAYGGSLPNEENLYDTTRVNQVAWTLVVILMGVVFWLCFALVHAENERFAMEKSMCKDPAFPTQVDTRCLPTVHSRDHWWEHLWYAVRHVI
ncbi:hypothetical protein E4L96_18705 [Massilia arenosa]|uniref:Uncharacterized protein n=1 Tax=Zemynaea arenosa TaxID=2561931 RepID=A0A4Y9S5U4_9BURK|nr:hypothetical protein [Massilia arenosa]TFW14868.1 hypothetical protein E4L96_18705 [Massilia arenosa]